LGWQGSAEESRVQEIDRVLTMVCAAEAPKYRQTIGLYCSDATLAFHPLRITSLGTTSIKFEAYSRHRVYSMYQFQCQKMLRLPTTTRIHAKTTRPHLGVAVTIKPQYFAR